jgi:predicted MFS family arabinose efflux permease
MAIALVSIVTRVHATPPAPRRQRIGLLEPIAALRDRRLLAASVVALLYNFGFFALLAYTPLPLGLGVHQLGIVFFGWGVLLAAGAVFGAPALSRRHPLVPLLAVALALIVGDLVVVGAGIGDHAVVIPAIIASGLFLGVGNALLSTLLMGVSTVNASVAASATNFIRFAGGCIAPFLAGKLGEHVSVGAPLFAAAGVVLAGLVLLVACRRLLTVDGPRTLTAVDSEHAPAVEPALAAAS